MSGEVKVADHSVRFPPAEELYFIGIDVGTHEGGGTARSEGAGVDFVGLDVERVGANEVDAKAESVGDVCRSDELGTIGCVVCTERSVRRSVATDVKHATAD